ncbi:SMP-30 gluconolaconase LRE domain protein [Xylographa carneopallida]|nr:SMP-30 gluconolaconase LRE domain protein [Xylographa carneopallida]
MRFSLTLFVSTLAALASCQSGPNAFDIPPAGDYLLNAGQPTTFTWTNLSGSTVTLTLRDGPNGNLNAGSVIVANLPNTGTYTYTPPTNIVAGNSYTIEITNDQDPAQTNYTPQFDIISNNQPVPSSASASGSMSNSGSATMSMTAASSGTTDTSMTSTSMVTTTASGSSTSAMTTMTTGTVASSASTSSTQASSSSSGTSTVSASQTTSVTKNNGAAALQAGIGLGAVLVVAMAFL